MTRARKPASTVPDMDTSSDAPAWREFVPFHAAKEEPSAPPRDAWWTRPLIAVAHVILFVVGAFVLLGTFAVSGVRHLISRLAARGRSL